MNLFRKSDFKEKLQLIIFKIVTVYRFLNLEINNYYFANIDILTN